MNSRRARRKLYELSFLQIAMLVIAFLFITFSLTAGSASAAATLPRVVVMTLNSEVNPILVYAMGGLVGLVGLYVVTLIVRTRRRAVKIGTEDMIGAFVITSTPLQPLGRVKYKDEDWTAKLDNPSASIDPGAEVRIIAVEGLLLHVQPVVYRLSDSALDTFRGNYCP